MTDTLIDVRVPGCAGNLFLGDCLCPNCGVTIQITVQNVCGSRFEARCPCGQAVIGNLPR